MRMSTMGEGGVANPMHVPKIKKDGQGVHKEVIEKPKIEIEKR